MPTNTTAETAVTHSDKHKVTKANMVRLEGKIERLYGRFNSLHTKLNLLIGLWFAQFAALVAII